VSYSFLLMQAGGGQLRELASLYDAGHLRPLIDRRSRSTRPSRRWRTWSATRPHPGRSTLDSIRVSSFVVVLQLRIVMFLYSGSEATLLSRLFVALAASREK
jgi:hypothetical protein